MRLRHAAEMLRAGLEVVMEEIVLRDRMCRVADVGAHAGRKRRRVYNEVAGEFLLLSPRRAGREASSPCSKGRG